MYYGNSTLLDAGTIWRPNWQGRRYVQAILHTAQQRR